MSDKSTHNLDFNGLELGKDKSLKDQFSKVYKGFYEQPQSMKMLSIKLNIDRANICWFCRELRANNNIEVAKKGLCEITNRVVNYYTTNPDLFPESNQLKLF